MCKSTADGRPLGSYGNEGVPIFTLAVEPFGQRAKRAVSKVRRTYAGQVRPVCHELDVQRHAGGIWSEGPCTRSMGGM
jgi:ribosomal protein L37AE/L43A